MLCWYYMFSLSIFFFHYVFILETIDLLVLLQNETQKEMVDSFVREREREREREWESKYIKQWVFGEILFSPSEWSEWIQRLLSTWPKWLHLHNNDTFAMHFSFSFSFYISYRMHAIAEFVLHVSAAMRTKWTSIKVLVSCMLF